MLRRIFNRYPLASFYIIAVLIAALVMMAFFVWMAMNPTVAATLPGYLAFVEGRNTYGNLLEIARYTFQEQPAAILILVFAAAPTLAAILTCMVRGGRPSLLALLDRLRPLRNEVGGRQGLAVYGTFLLLYLIGCALFLWMNDTMAGPFAFDKAYQIAGGAPLALLGTLLAGLLIDEGGTLEELGWRGYALPLLLSRMRSPLRATLVLGVMWWGWHLPREITALMGPLDVPVYLWNQFVFLLLCLALSVLITLMFNLTGGSVWAGILIHGGTNVWAKALGGPLYGALGFDLRTAIVLMAAIVVIALTRGRLGAPLRVSSE